MYRIVFAFLAIPLLASFLAAQLKVDVALINLVATVTDSNGRYVHDLTAEDLIVKEDGEVQEISHFNQSHDLPVSVGIVLDTSGSMQSKIDTATGAVERFVRAIHEDDDIFLMGFSDYPNIRQDFTDDRNKLATALRRINVGGGTALYDAVYHSLGKMKSGKHDKKAILLISDGQDTTSSTSYERTLLRVRESEIMIYALGIAPGTSFSSRGPATFPRIPNIPGFPIPRMPGGSRGSSPDTIDMNILRAFANSSGGKAWLLSGDWSRGNANEVQYTLDEIADELRSQYSLGYYPLHPLKDGKWHRVEIRARNSRYHVRYRNEYFGG